MVSNKISKINYLIWEGLRHSVPKHLKNSNCLRSEISLILTIDNKQFDILEKKSKDHYGHSYCLNSCSKCLHQRCIPGAHLKTRFRAAFHRQQAPWGGVLLEILGGGVPPGSRNPDRISDKKNLIYHTRFQTQAFGRNYVIITYIRAQTKEFFKNISNSHISLFFLLIWN